MRWQYRTVVFEFQKDGLLGNRFIDDEEVENTLNEQGRAGWELVSATMVQDGLLTLFKRPDRQNSEQRAAEDMVTAPAEGQKPRLTEEEALSVEELQELEREHIKALENRRKQVMEEEQSFMVGDIKIR